MTHFNGGPPGAIEGGTASAVMRICYRASAVG